VAAQCAILFIGPDGSDAARIASLRSLGFRVEESTVIPGAAEVAPHHAVVIHGIPPGSLTMLAARLRRRHTSIDAPCWHWCHPTCRNVTGATR